MTEILQLPKLPIRHVQDLGDHYQVAAKGDKFLLLAPPAIVRLIAVAAHFRHAQIHPCTACVSSSRSIVNAIAAKSAAKLGTS